MLLDFWTFCCINCLHVIEELRPVEEEFHDVLVTIGRHASSCTEADQEAFAPRSSATRWAIRSWTTRT